MVNEEDIQAYFILEARSFVDEQVEEAAHVVEQENRKDAFDHLTNTLNALVGYRNALRGLSGIVACEEAIDVIDEGREKIHRLMTEVAFFTNDSFTPWERVIDEALVTRDIDVYDRDDSYQEAKRKFDNLLDYVVAVATDPRVNGGYKLVKDYKGGSKTIKMPKNHSNFFLDPED